MNQASYGQGCIEYTFIASYYNLPNDQTYIIKNFLQQLVSDAKGHISVVIIDGFNALFIEWDKHGN